MKYIKFFLLSLGIILPFIAGLVILSDALITKFSAGILVIIAIIAVFVSDKMSGYVVGSGIKRINVGANEPSDASKGDIWVDTSEK